MSGRTLRRRAPWLLAGLILAMSTGCGHRGPAGKTPTAAPSDPTFRDFGNFEVHFNAIRSDELPTEVARAYGIERSANRVMLNVALMRKHPNAQASPADGDVTVTAYNLNGQLKDLKMRRISEGSSIYFIGEVSISGDEILVFDISATPLGQRAKYTVQFKREFFAG